MRLVAAIVSIVLCTGLSAQAAGKTVPIISPNLYVAPDGNDSNPGTEEKPFATLAGARDAVRQFKKNVPKPITVFVREGAYYLKEPLVFGPEDSGTDLQPITYAAYPSEKPTISGGVELKVTWQPYRDGIMKCAVPKGMEFTQFFINGKRQIRARFPNFDPQNPLVSGNGYINTTGGQGREFSYAPETFTKKKWSRPSEAVVHVFPGHYWCNVQFWIKSIDRQRHAILLGRGGWQKRDTDAPNSFSSESRFFVENVFEELDAPNVVSRQATECSLLQTRPRGGPGQCQGGSRTAQAAGRIHRFQGPTGASHPAQRLSLHAYGNDLSGEI